MASTLASALSARVRAALVVGTTVLLVPGLAGPASAMNPAAPGVGTVNDDGEDRGTPMSPGQAFVLFVLVPLGVAAIVWLLVKAPGWTRSGRTQDEAWTGTAVEVGTSDRPGIVESGQAAPEAGDPEGLAELTTASEETGGTGARW